MLSSEFQFSQGSAATYCRCVGRSYTISFSDEVQRMRQWKKILLTLVHICESY